MERKDILTYCQLMDDVKGRIVMLDNLATRKITMEPDLARLEFSALLLRKSLEQVALANLVSNKALFTITYDNFSRYYHAERILKDIERINPCFYPLPVEHKGKDPETGIAHLEPLKDGFLTRKEFEKAYDKCHKLLHAENPYGSKTDLAYFDKKVPEWNRKLHRLLFQHRMQIVGDPNFYVIHLNEEDGKCHHYTLTPIEFPNAEK